MKAGTDKSGILSRLIPLHLQVKRLVSKNQIIGVQGDSGVGRSGSGSIIT